MKNPAKVLPLKARQVVDQLAKKGLGSLYNVRVDHLDSCQLGAGKPCSCTPRVSLTETVPNISKFSEDQQREIASFRQSSAVGPYRADLAHTDDCDTHNGQDCDCEPVLSFKGETILAGEMVASAVQDMASATRAQTAVLQDLALAVHKQTDVLAAVMAKDEKVEFTRDNKGRITSAKIKGG